MSNLSPAGQLAQGGRGPPAPAWPPADDPHPARPGDGWDVDHNLFWPLWALSGTTSVSFAGTETVRDSLGRRYLVQTDLNGYGGPVQLEPWAFRVPMAHLAWSRPSPKRKAQPRCAAGTDHGPVRLGSHVCRW